ncbi:MAG: radical SAM protein, partial [Actinobacteria bacterium]|nr:radical SAM protein [Actinomycetota bacterium]
METFASRLSNCICCPRACGVDRLAGELGVCGIGRDALVAHAGPHFGEEPPISGTRGSGTIFFAGCNLRCVFCQNHQISQDFGRRDARGLTAAGLADEMLRLQDRGAHNVNFVSPSHVAAQMADAVVAARGRGLAVPVVYNSNGYDAVDMLRDLRGLVDVYLPDLKYLDAGLAARYSGAEDYPEVVPGVLEEMLDQVGHLRVDDDGVATRGLLVRHLVLPGHLENSRRCLGLLAELSPDVFVSVMSQYSPQHKACDHPGIDRHLTAAEYREIVDCALELGLENAFLQELA